MCVGDYSATAHSGQRHQPLSWAKVELKSSFWQLFFFFFSKQCKTSFVKTATQSTLSRFWVLETKNDREDAIKQCQIVTKVSSSIVLPPPPRPPHLCKRQRSVGRQQVVQGGGGDIAHAELTLTAPFRWHGADVTLKERVFVSVLTPTSTVENSKTHAPCWRLLYCSTFLPSICFFFPPPQVFFQTLIFFKKRRFFFERSYFCFFKECTLAVVSVLFWWGRGNTLVWPNRAATVLSWLMILYLFFYFFSSEDMWVLCSSSAPPCVYSSPPARSPDDHMPEAPSPMLAVWLMQGSVWTVLGKSWVRIRPFSPPLPFPLILVRVEQRMASLMDCCQGGRNTRR